MKLKSFLKCLVTTGMVSMPWLAAAADLTLDQKLDILVKSYPDTITSVTGGHVVFKSKAEAVTIDDGKKRDHF